MTFLFDNSQQALFSNYVQNNPKNELLREYNKLNNLRKNNNLGFCIMKGNTIYEFLNCDEFFKKKSEYDEQKVINETYLVIKNKREIPNLTRIEKERCDLLKRRHMFDIENLYDENFSYEFILECSNLRIFGSSMYKYLHKLYFETNIDDEEIRLIFLSHIVKNIFMVDASIFSIPNEILKIKNVSYEIAKCMCNNTSYLINSSCLYCKKTHVECKCLFDENTSIGYYFDILRQYASSSNNSNVTDILQKIAKNKTVFKNNNVNEDKTVCKNNNVNEDNTNKYNCIVCLKTKDVKYICAPCGHTNLCNDCFKTKKRCPTCNSSIVMHSKLFE